MFCRYVLTTVLFIYRLLRVQFLAGFLTQIERKIEHSIFRDMETNERIWLDELPEDAGNFKTEPAISCDLSCGLAMAELND